jgi:hypothetical protein
MGKKRVQNLVDHSEHVDKVSMSELSDAKYYKEDYKWDIDWKEVGCLPWGHYNVIIWWRPPFP